MINKKYFNKRKISKMMEMMYYIMIIKTKEEID